MLVAISDIHFVDGTAGEHNLPFSAFESVFLSDVASLAQEKDAKEVKLLLLGDMFDVIRSTQWFDVDPEDRPWGTNRYLVRVQNYYRMLLDKARKKESGPGGLTAGKLSDIEFELEEFSNKLDKLIAMPHEPLVDDGMRVNIDLLQKLGLLASPVLSAKNVNRAIPDRNRWREDDGEQDTVWDIKKL